MPALVASAKRILDRLGAISDVPGYVLLPGAERILTHAQQNCPVDTGFLRSTGYIVLRDDDVEIGFSADYASYVEFGTRKMDAQPYLRPAIDDSEEEFLVITAHEYEKYIDEISRYQNVPAPVNTQGNPFGLEK